MFSKQFNDVNPEALLLSAAVLLPLVAVVAGCAICRRLWRKVTRRNDEEDEEKRPLLRENTRQQSFGTESVEHSPQQDRSSGEQTSPTNTGNRIDVPCVVHVNEAAAATAASAADQKPETKTSTAAEVTLISDLIKTDEDEASAAEYLGRIQPQQTDSVLEPRPVIENGVDRKVAFSDSVEDAFASKEISREHLEEETDAAKEAHGPAESEADQLPKGRETLQEPHQPSASEEAKKTDAVDSVDSVDSAAAPVDEGISEEKKTDPDPVHCEEPTDTGNTKEINEKITDSVDATEQATTVKTKTDAAAAAAAAADDDDDETVKDNTTTAAQEASSAIEKLEEIDFQVKPSFVKTIRTKAAKKEGKATFGVTALDDELFVISQHCSDVEVYDSTGSSVEFKRQFHVEHLFDPIDIVSCPTNRCLYIFDWKSDSLPNEILRLDSEGRLLLKWATGPDDGGFLSMTAQGNVILSVWEKSVLREYSPEGQEVREIQLPAAVVELRLGVRLSSGKLIVSQGEDESAEHRVCLLDEKGEEILRSFGGEKGSSSEQLNGPNYMAVDMKSGFVLVADQNNKRVILLDKELKFKREIVEESDGLRYPVRLRLVTGGRGRLIVADNDFNLHDQVWRDGRIMIFDFNIQRQSVE